MKFILLLFKHGKCEKYLSAYNDKSHLKSWKRSILKMPYLGYFSYQLKYILFHDSRHRARYLEPPEADFIFYRIPKTGSTSLLKYLLEKHYSFNLSENSKDINKLAERKLSLMVREPERKLLTVVRNPRERFISAHSNISESSNPYVLKDYLFEILPKDLDINEMLRRITMIPERLLDDHFQSQSYLIDLAFKQPEVYKLEEGLQKLPFTDPIWFSFSKLNVSKEKNSLSPDSEKILKTYYKRDYDRWY
ncbi:sulfotransferase family 2 domain-containing protein [Mangrovivirga sp. M17]|uniref:Sulfotransferase family 2 domain-containing protein n=1 Tax=Mangrovivirga halotolerans TaxID=2993936 RepID=A0ABT3RPA4_9BACT|nr:sulfotransferase family 2 domain-containing protein [Mangrovivirga halotolerans]MCX2743614.1 sulfotransferase family 2 domain-containing protein [Mangrovivirga halotolerans]